MREYSVELTTYDEDGTKVESVYCADDKFIEALAGAVEKSRGVGSCTCLAAVMHDILVCKGVKTSDQRALFEAIEDYLRSVDFAFEEDAA